MHSSIPFESLQAPWPLHVVAVQVVSMTQLPESSCAPGLHEQVADSPLAVHTLRFGMVQGVGTQGFDVHPPMPSGCSDVGHSLPASGAGGLGGALSPQPAPNAAKSRIPNGVSSDVDRFIAATLRQLQARFNASSGPFLREPSWPLTSFSSSPTLSLEARSIQ
jgi:hypothetical protein